LSAQADTGRLRPTAQDFSPTLLTSEFFGSGEPPAFRVLRERGTPGL